MLTEIFRTPGGYIGEEIRRRATEQLLRVEGETDRQTGRQTDRQADRLRTDRQAYGGTEKLQKCNDFTVIDNLLVMVMPVK